MPALTPELNEEERPQLRAATIFRQHLDATHRHTDRRFAWLMGLQWVAGIGAALWISPKAWEGEQSQVHIHVWAAIFLGGIISGFPVFLAVTRPGSALTRHVIAAGQMLSCGLLIHLTGGRIESHFQYFGTLAFLAFYRDWKVLLTATIVALVDHFVRALYWPESIFGVLTPSAWRAAEHAGWILVEDIFLVLAIDQNLREMLGVAKQQAQLEALNRMIEHKVDERTDDLKKEIEERRRTEGTLRESEEKFTQLAENISDVFWITSPDLQKMYYVSPGYELIWGRAAESLVANPHQWIEAIVSEDRDRALGVFAGLMKDQPTVSIEYQIDRPDGTTRWIHDRGFQVRDAAGKLIRLTGIASDITARRKAEESLRLLNSAVVQSKEAITITEAKLDSPGPRIIFVNPAFTKMTGYSAEEVIGKTPRMFQGPRTDRAVLKRLRDNLEGGEIFEGETINYRKDGSEFDLEWQIAPIRDTNGKTTHYVSIQRDITERKRIVARLFQSQKMETVGRLAGGVAHEFNSILTAIIGQSEFLLNQLEPVSAMGKSAREIRQAAERAATLTRQLLAYGRKQILQPEIIDLNRMLSDMLSTLQHLMSNTVDVQIIPATGLGKVKIDPGQMEQLIVSVAMNAADAMPNGGKLTLETANVSLDEAFVQPFPGLKPGDYVQLALTDTGGGMNTEVKARVFEPFFSTKGVGQGTGLGLATCYGIVQQSEGHISVYSEPGRGATFKVYLPQVPATEKRPLPPLQAPGMPLGTETILLAEDDPSLLEMAAAMLKRLGYTVVTAINGVEALRLMNQRNIGHIDLLLTDVVMPHMSGKELSDRIQSIHPNTRILFTSAYAENAIVHQGILDESVTLLQKPFTPSALANKVREVLDQASPLKK
jgi:two-component system cell cycle sensor histidine kinase/response regulator CckA